MKDEIYSIYSDNNEMHSWYMSYKEKNRNFETIIHDSLKEYQELDLASIWSFIKLEFISIIKKLKRIPNHGEVIIQDDIDIEIFNPSSICYHYLVIKINKYWNYKYNLYHLYQNK